MARAFIYDQIGAHFSVAPFGALHNQPFQGPFALVPVLYVIGPCEQVGALPSSTTGAAVAGADTCGLGAKLR